MTIQVQHQDGMIGNSFGASQFVTRNHICFGIFLLHVAFSAHWRTSSSSTTWLMRDEQFGKDQQKGKPLNMEMKKADKTEG